MDESKSSKIRYDGVSLVPSSSPELIKMLARNAGKHYQPLTPDENYKKILQRRIREKEEKLVVAMDIGGVIGLGPLVGPHSSPEEETLRQTNIKKSICPTCGGHLLRGKKNKLIEYKRTWNCINCGTQHYM